MLARIGEALDSEIVTLGDRARRHLRVAGGHRAAGSIDVKTSKNAGVALLCASLLNRGTTTLRKVARIEEVNRILEVLDSIGVAARWLNADNDLEIVRPPPSTWPASTTRPPAAPARSSCSSARCCTAPASSSSPTPAAATSAPAPSSRT